MEDSSHKIYRCEKCNNEYTNRQNLWRHKQKCINENKNNNKKNDEKNKNETLIKCKECKKIFNTTNELDHHMKLVCKPDLRHNNVYTFKTNTFGKNKYINEEGGDMYIIQTEFNLKGYYKIGVSNNLYHRMEQYRCGLVLEPRIHCYFPVKNIRIVDKIMKKRLKKYNIKREIYYCENINEIKDILKSLQKEFKSEEIEVIPEIKECDVCQCDYCKKVFTSKYELTIHLNECEQKKIIDETKYKSKQWACKKCNKKFNNYQNKWRHEKNCKENEKNQHDKKDQIIDNLKKIIMEQDKKMEQFKKELLDIMIKECKIHPQTLNKINKQLNGNNNTIT
jgi:hypothetical protein